MKKQLVNRLGAYAVTALMGAALLTGCQGSQAESTVAEEAQAPAAEAVPEAAEQTETAAEQVEAAAETAQETTKDTAKQEEAAAESELKAPYFTKGVYSSFPASEADAEHTYFYVFYDEGAGYTEDAMSGIGLPFACEQTDDTVVFHMGGADEESKDILTIESVENGVVTGTVQNGIRISFAPEPSADPDNFDAQKYAGTANN